MLSRINGNKRYLTYYKSEESHRQWTVLLRKIKALNHLLYGGISYLGRGVRSAMGVHAPFAFPGQGKTKFANLLRHKSISQVSTEV